LTVVFSGSEMAIVSPAFGDDAAGTEPSVM
jgi:hypothetical protein